MGMHEFRMVIHDRQRVDVEHDRRTANTGQRIAVRDAQRKAARGCRRTQIDPGVADFEMSRRQPDRQSAGELNQLDTVFADLQQHVMRLDRRIVDRERACSCSTNEMTAERQLDTPTCIRTRCHPNLHHLLRVFTGSNRKPVRGLLPTDVGGLRWLSLPT
jgi:hypothetical protein